MRFRTAAVLAVLIGLFLGLILGSSAAAVQTAAPRPGVVSGDDERQVHNARQVIWPQRRPILVRGLRLREAEFRTAYLARPAWGLTGGSKAGNPILDTFLARQDPGLDGILRRELATAVLQESDRQGIDPWLVLAVIRVESNFDPGAVGGAGEIGLMQILPDTARQVARWSLGDTKLDPRRLYDPAVNVRLGTAYLASLLRERNGDLVGALAAYNGGDRPGRFSFQYATRVLCYYRSFQAAGGNPQGDF